MKINENFILKNIAGSAVVLPVGEEAGKIKGMITLNEAAEFIWKKIENGSDYDGILNGLIEEYNAPQDVLKNDLDDFLKVLKEKNIII